MAVSSISRTQEIVQAIFLFQSKVYLACNDTKKIMEKKPKILLVHNYYKIPGGEDTVVANEKKLLEDNGHEVVLYTRSNSEIDRFSFFQKLMLPFRAIFNRKTYRDIKKIIREQHIDIVHVHNTLTLISPSVYYAALKCKVPVVQTIHNFRLICPAATLYRDGHICEECLNHGLHCAVKHKCYRNSRLQTRISVAILKRHRRRGIYKKINYICLTEFNKKMICDHSQIKPEQVFVKPNFTFQETGREIIPYEKRERQFVFVGRLEKLKGIDVLFEAWAAMGDAAPKLVVCGSGPMEEWCKEFIAERNISNIQLLGQVDNKTAKELMAHSLALIFPTQWYEGFPMTIVEAYSVGTPVIGPDMGNVGDLIEEGVTGWKYRDDLISLLEGICFEPQSTQTEFFADPKMYWQRLCPAENYKQLSAIYECINHKRDCCDR